MAHYIVSFTISTDRNSYEEVYRSLIEAIRNEASAVPWDETSSFLAFESPKSTADLMSTLYFGSDLIETKDVLLLINLSQGEYISRGEDYPHLLKDRIGLSKA